MKTTSSLFLLLLVSFYPYSDASAQDDGEPLRCVSLNRIDRTEVIDDQTIAFHLRGGDILLNRLGRTCNGLAREDRFSYRVTSGQLCRSDSITVLENSVFGLGRGASCVLNDFDPSDEDELAVLKKEELEAEVTVEEVDPDE
jgi:hypothetical protein